MAARLCNKINRNLINNITKKQLSLGNATVAEDASATVCKGFERTNGAEQLSERMFSRKPIASTTHQCLIVPTARLSNPFSISGQVLDMQTAQHNLNVTSSRNYSSKKKKNCPDGQCRKFVLCNCDQAERTTCLRDPRFPNCTKKEAPYPCFSETCYEEPYNKPSECKLCPWRPEDHPTFKNTKRNFHTVRPFNPNFIKENVEVKQSIEETNSKKPMTNLLEDLFFRNPEVLNCKKKHDYNPKCPDTDRCYKFPFKPIKKKHKKVVDKCKKKKRTLVVDCPLSKKCMSIMNIANGMAIEEIAVPSGSNVMQCSKENCPDTPMCDCPRNICKKKRKGKDGVCRTDLLDNSRYKIKKKKKSKRGRKGRKGGKRRAAGLEILPPMVEPPMPTQPSL